jgi:hypothetical protein
MILERKTTLHTKCRGVLMKIENGKYIEQPGRGFSPAHQT